MNSRLPRVARIKNYKPPVLFDLGPDRILERRSKYDKIHDILNDIYKGKVEGTTFEDLFTTEDCWDTLLLQPNCASMIHTMIFGR